MDKPDRISPIYIAATAERVWAALLDPELSKTYFFGHRVEIGDHVGAPFALRRPDGGVDSQGEVLAWDPPRRLALSWKVVRLEDLPPGKVEYRIDDAGEAVRLTVSEYLGGPKPEHWDEGRDGWARVLSGLKTLLETGKPLKIGAPG